MKRNPIKTETEYRKRLKEFLEDEQKGIREYKKLLLDLPVNPEANKVRSIIKDILADEERHEKILLRLAIF